MNKVKHHLFTVYSQMKLQQIRFMYNKTRLIVARRVPRALRDSGGRRGQVLRGPQGVQHRAHGRARRAGEMGVRHTNR